MKERGLGVVGFGAFGLFALQNFLQVPGIKLVAMAATHREAALAAVKRFGLSGVEETETLLQRSDVELVYIATPPFLHYDAAIRALQAGKHVIVEKPMALTLAEADEMIGLAQERGLLAVTNLMQRYNPLYESVRALIERKVLGELIHAFLQNYASDEHLPAEHWFWDRAKSGGIFVEHGVHFFDMFAGWIGPGKVESAQVTVRPGTTLEDQALCTMRYRDDVLATFFHTFTQPARMDRQEFRLVFERGDLRLEGWVPTSGTVHALADEAQTRALHELFPGRLDAVAIYSGKDRVGTGRHKAIDVYQMVKLTFGDAHEKMTRYGQLLREMLLDQVRWLEDRNYPRRVTEEHGRNALAASIEADRVAHQTNLGV